MELLIFDDKNSWVELKDGVRIKVDYCNIKQQYQLNNRLSGLLEENITEEHKHQIMYEYAYYMVKYHLKDWIGVGTSPDNPIKLELIDNEIPDNLMNAIANKANFFWEIYYAINELVRFDSNDKKK